MRIQLLLIAIAAAVIVASADPHDDEWKAWKATHGRKFSHPKEEAKRKSLHKTRSMKIKQHNQEHAEGKHSYKMALNHMSDWTDEELNTVRNEVDPSEHVPAPGGVMEPVNTERATYPASLNYATSTCMQPVQDQGMCGDCYAFAATAVAEFLRCNVTGKQVKMSEQSVADCSSPYGNNKCNGGLALYGWNFMMQNGLANATAYPYTSGNTGLDGTCTYSKSKCYGVNMTTWGYATTTNDESVLVAALNTYGPMAISIYASDNLMNYAGGVFQDPTCPTDNTTNHAVVLVGYGTDPATNLDYWVIRNSWSPYWGESGYARVRRGVNWCSISKRPVWAKVNAAQPTC